MTGSRLIDSKAAGATRHQIVSLTQILTYHKIGHQFEVGITSVTRRRFAQHLDVILSTGKDLVMASDGVMPGNHEGKIALTFDDGYETVYTNAFPEMAARGMAGTIFPVVGAIGRDNSWDVRLSFKPFRHLSWSQIGELVRHGFELGSHTMSHRDLTRLAEPDLKEELRTSRLSLEDHIGIDVRAIAYPFGKVNQRVLEAARAAGYKCGFLSAPARTCSKAQEGTPGGKRMGMMDRGGEVPLDGEAGGEMGAKMAIGRMSVYCIDDSRSLLRKLGVVRGYRFEALKCRIVARLSHGTTLVKR